MPAGNLGEWASLTVVEVGVTLEAAASMTQFAIR
jgi:hypothetical protein